MLGRVWLGNTFSGMLGRGGILRLKLKAIRSGIWFRALRRIDRALIDLTLRVVDKVNSDTLAKALISVLTILENALENRVSRAVREVGFQVARKMSLVAQGWGNVSAGSWATDLSFAKFLAIIHINNPMNFMN
jgi:hypothetical protein